MGADVATTWVLAASNTHPPHPFPSSFPPQLEALAFLLARRQFAELVYNIRTALAQHLGPAYIP